MKKFEYKNLTPFKWFVLENFPFIEADFDALTEWQLFCKLGTEINKIIDSQNVVGEQAETLTNAFNNLKNYVDNYFDNLDEEIGRVNTVINLLETDISKIKEEQTRQNENISTNADEITNLKNENSYLQNVVKQAFTETSASGTELTINNTIEARMEMKLNGNTSQNGEPTPATPQEIHCVKGNNVVKVTNQNLFDESEEYPISLGSLELCKIGDYQDRIYQDNNKWYLEKQIGKVILNGSSNRFTQIYSTNRSGINRYRTNEIPVKLQTAGQIADVYCNKLLPKTIGNTYGRVQGISVSDAIAMFLIYIDDIGTYTLKQANNWLSTNNLEIYYVLATPTTTEITDTTLITQLDEISQALSKKGTTIISQNNDDLPFYIDAVALTK